MTEKIDIVFINPNNSNQVYQKLSSKYSAVEPPTWSLLLAQSCRSKGFHVDIIDANAENLTDTEVFNRLKKLDPKYVCFVVYGQNVNSGTTNMAGATKNSKYLKSKNLNKKIIFIGSHVQALPIETIKNERSIDIICTNEGVYALHNLLKLDDLSEQSLKDVKGIIFIDKNKNVIFNEAERIVPQENIDIDLPGYAWDLLPYKEKPFDLYRSPMWHAGYVDENRSPYAAIQTSLGCQFKCDFCMINIINREDNDEVGVASNYNKMRYWSPEFIIKEFDKLLSYGVKTIKITDEMFLLNPKYYLPLCKLLKERNQNNDLRIWAYSRIDTVKRKEVLQTVKDAGIKWLCLGIESADKTIRLEISKGKFEDVDVKKVVEQIHEAGIEVMANYIYGLPGDNAESMKKTLDLSIDLCTSGWNSYAAMALPGSSLYKQAKDKGLELPKTYSAYSFHSYETLPLSNEFLSAKDILMFRDNAFIKYHKNKAFLSRIENIFGKNAVENINEMLKVKLDRKIFN